MRKKIEVDKFVAIDGGISRGDILAMMPVALQNKILLMASGPNARRSVRSKRLAGRHSILLIEHDIDRVWAISNRITILHMVSGLIAYAGDAEALRQDETLQLRLLGVWATPKD